MTDCRLDVLCIGNAIVDVISDTTDAFLDQEGLTKGSMRLIDAEEAERLYAHMGPAREISGGSAANTAAGVAAVVLIIMVSAGATHYMRAAQPDPGAPANAGTSAPDSSSRISCSILMSPRPRMRSCARRSRSGCRRT